MSNVNQSGNNTSKSQGTQPLRDSSTVANVQKKIVVEEISDGLFRATTPTSKYIIEYDMNKCIGAASCAVLAPLTFFMNEENRAVIKDDGDVWDDDDMILSAAESCPVLAIKIINKETDEVIFPIEDF